MRKTSKRFRKTSKRFRKTPKRFRKTSKRGGNDEDKIPCTSIYIIYDTDDGCPSESYRKFDDAIDVVSKRIEKVNAAYVDSPDFKIEPQLPGSMDDYNILNVKSGIVVANLYEYRTSISIKEILLC